MARLMLQGVSRANITFPFLSYRMDKEKDLQLCHIALHMRRRVGNDDDS